MEDVGDKQMPRSPRFLGWLDDAAVEGPSMRAFTSELVRLATVEGLDSSSRCLREGKMVAPSGRLHSEKQG